MSTTTSSKTITVLRQLFARYGLPELIVSDNGSQFTSEEFVEFMRSNGVKHIWCSSYHPSSNGAVKRPVCTYKQAMKANHHDHLSLQQRLENFRLSYHITPHATTGEAPCTLFLGHNLRTRLDPMLPSVQERVEVKQVDQKSHHDIHSKLRHFDPGQHVMIRDKRPTALTAWVPGVIVQQRGPLTYLVKMCDGQLWKRHTDHLNISSPPDLQEDSAPYPSAPSTTDVSTDTPTDLLTSHPRTSNPPCRYLTSDKNKMFT